MHWHAWPPGEGPSEGEGGPKQASRDTLVVVVAVAVVVVVA
jgi:hypothetical protein